MRLERQSPCKVNLILNILGRRADGFHELETVMHPVRLHDVLSYELQAAPGIVLTCSDSALPVDNTNLVCKAATQFFAATGISSGVRIHLQKNIPMAAGLGGGSGNAATSLLALNELHGFPLGLAELQQQAAALGSDIPFFLQTAPALAVGRGERIESLASFQALTGKYIVLIHPGFGISTPWAYQNLARFPEALHGRPGRARRLIELLNTSNLETARSEFYNSLEAPALEKYPVLKLYQEFLRQQGAPVALMSGSGSTTFAIFSTLIAAEEAVSRFRAEFGKHSWITVVPL